ncbi:hypothetical protein GCM10007989_19020 [Devosia pacifica]|uniref:Transcription regulator PadR N-terminal domain-containing protein n=1 Tax=Devosia pacifica TaxID=1335967 RepID=A0A918VTX0_9HYPH|nr:PadR family transcriptional regulator [Devosia pacifica]GHA23706.1 hypothetical protein GCM10007989_19020 [Devosia pacifica]
MGRYFRNGEPDWREIERLARRGFGRVAEMAGDRNFSGWGDNLRMGRMLASGDVRLVALYLIEQQPRHGYELIKAIEERSNGVYAPSPGLVYPALTYLEEAGYVTSQADGNKKRYTITDSGRQHLDENRDAVRSTLDFLSRAGEQVNRFRDYARRDWASERAEKEQSQAQWDYEPARPHKNPEEDKTPEPDADDRDLEDVLPEVNAARRELKAAIKKARKGNGVTQRRLAGIMRQAAAEIRLLESDDDVDI